MTKKRLLVVDDDAEFGGLLRHALELASYDVTLARNGVEALKVAPVTSPDLILCDVNMPGLSGMEVVKALRQDPTFANRPIVLMTGDQYSTPHRRGMDLGADDYLAKPFKISELLECIKTRLHLARLRAHFEEGTVHHLRHTINSTLPHEFFTPLAGVIGLTQIIKDSYDSLGREEIIAILGDIDISARRLHRTLKNYLSILHLDERFRFGESASAQELGGEVLKMVVDRACEVAGTRRGRTSDIKITDLEGQLGTNAEDLAVIIEELVDNACRFSPPGTPVEVSIRPIGSKCQLCVVDQGRGMTPQQIAEVGAFRQFDRQKYEQQGLGLGFALIGRLTRFYRGELTINSTTERGTTCRVLLPAFIAPH